MPIVSYTFLCFIAAIFLVYFNMPDKHKWKVLLAASYLYYAISDLDMMFFIVFTTITVFAAAIAMDNLYVKQRELLKEKDKEWLRENKKKTIAVFAKKRLHIMLAALLVNFGILGFLKYYNFGAQIVNQILPNSFNQVKTFELLLPLGISFYTFQILGYLIDVHRGKYAADRNIFQFALFVSYFPQIIQGPISRYEQLAHQLFAPHSFDYTRVKFGVQLIGWGFFKKLVIADRAGILVDAVLPSFRSYSGVEIGVTILAFLLQVYADFSGGMDIARGVSQCLGIDMVLNFRRPHFAVSISDYWQRWHITLGAWMKDYLLYPLTFSRAWSKLGKFSRKHFKGNLGKILPTCLAMSIVFFVVGIWHGPEWKYVMFGFYNGGLIVAGILLNGPIQNFNKKHPNVTTKNMVSMRILASLGTFFLVFIGKYFAAAPNILDALRMMKSTFTTFNPQALWNGFFVDSGFGIHNVIVLVGATMVFAIISFLQEKGHCVREMVSTKPMVMRYGLYYLFILAVILLGIDSSFSEMDFLYAGF